MASLNFVWNLSDVVMGLMAIINIVSIVLLGKWAFGALASSFYMFGRLIRISSWGYAIRYAIPTVIVFWTFVEVIMRWQILHEIWVHPLEYRNEMLIILVAFIVLLGVIIYRSWRRKG